MARIRSIKPEFCSSSDTGALSRDARLFFLQLLTEADDAGRLLWLPRRLSGVLYPHDGEESAQPVTERDLEQWASECAARGMLTLYRNGASTIAQVTNWAKHQRINRPTPSRIPAPSDAGSTRLHGGLTESSVSNHGNVCEDSREERNREGEQGKEGEQGVESPDGDSSEAAAGSKKPKREKVTKLPSQDERLCRAIIACYHEALPGCQRAETLTPKRKKRLLAAHKLARQVCEEQQWHVKPSEFWSAYFEQCAEDPWMRGEVPNPKNPRWKQNIDVLLAEDRFAGIVDAAITAMRREAAAA